jgi:addiction module HigA family antidote
MHGTEEAPASRQADRRRSCRTRFVGAVAAKSLGVTRQHLYNVIGGRTGVSAEMAVRLEKALGSTAESWLAMQSDYDLGQVERSAIKVSTLPRGVRRQRERAA